MTRAAAAGVLALALAGLGAAPIQCKHEPDPSARLEDTAGDALWDLAQDFKKRGNEPAARDTLRYLAERYPSSRYAAAARAELGVDAKPATIADAGFAP